MSNLFLFLRNNYFRNYLAHVLLHLLRGGRSERGRGSGSGSGSGSGKDLTTTGSLDF
jgi:hypothetical protein